MGLEQLQNAYKRDLAALYDDSEDGVTRAAKRLKTSSMTTSFYPPSPLTNPDSFPDNQEGLLPPWTIESESESEEDVCIIDECIINTPPHYYSEDEDAIASSPEPAKVDDADFQFSPASPPLVQRNQDDDDDADDDDDDDASLTTLYVFPDKTVVLTRDGEQVDIPDQHTITHTKPEPEPQPSTSTAHAHEEDADDDATDDEEEEDADKTGKVCFHKMQLHLARLITKLWRRTAPATVEEVTVDVCRSLASTVLSAEYQEHTMRYVRCAIRQPRAITRPLR